MAKETWSQRRARIKKEKAKAKTDKQVRDLKKALADKAKKDAADEVARKRREREQRRRNQGK